ncbi:DUF1540 domain-containing protein [Desulfitobacterium chlororespirans]|uniref:DUF1540 domain-containing protein n=1 Tax=Desulfitobacterium chlororespirans DSM 11544 TaxID=1121395 RepID=A0A1M7UWW1_9FIRM|nr:DUF1540 domain-containing protein [Desulfitobacterium chlororespirans]SHN87445.1 protein of unknown function [Desulfitobacterium chlororespirans DSM 11544]
MSIQLKCDAVNCVYNRSHLCSAEEIEVQGGETTGGDATFCGTFNSKSLGNFVSSLGNMNYSGTLKQAVSAEPIMDPKIRCNAVNCTYNDQRYCHADQVEIRNEVSHTAEETECQTFYPKMS